MDASRDLTGARALVTGANRGIGAAFVDTLLARGAAAVYAGARDPSTLDDARARHGDRLVPVRMDVTQPDDVEAFCAAHDDVDLLISNAGRSGNGAILEIPESEVRDLFDVHAIGPLRLARALAPQIRARHGGMIFVQSAAALALSRHGPAYSASKAAGMMLALALREALQGDGVQVTSAFPGFTDTDIVRSVDIVKASPIDVAERILDGWADGAACVFPDRFAELVHEEVVSNMDGLLDDPGPVMTATVRRYAAGE